MLKWNFIVLLSLAASYATLAGVSGGNPQALAFPIIPEAVFIKISKANRPRLSIEKNQNISIFPHEFQDACSLEGTNLRVAMSNMKCDIKTFLIVNA